MNNKNYVLNVKYALQSSEIISLEYASSYELGDIQRCVALNIARELGKSISSAMLVTSDGAENVDYFIELFNTLSTQETIKEIGTFSIKEYLGKKYAIEYADGGLCTIIY